MASKHILIIGAGIAGLAAANYLKNHGFKVTVVEARTRPGGRIYTDYSLGVPFDEGACWIHGTQDNPLVGLADYYQASYEFTDFNMHKALVIDQKQEAFPVRKLKHLDANFDELLKQASLFAYQHKDDLSLADALHQYLTLHRKFKFPANYFAWRLERIRGYTGADIQDLSARYWNQGKILAGGNYLMTKGYMPIILGLARRIHIALDTCVNLIKHTKKNVHLITSQGKLTGDAAIITLPLGVLKKQSVVFDAPLPMEKLKAIERLGMGVLDKIGLKFPVQFWPDQYDVLGYLKDAYDNIPLFVNYAYYFQQPVLVGYVSAKLAKHMEELSDPAIVDQAVNVLSYLFKQEVPKPIMTKILRWSQDPFSLGSYSFLPVGAKPEDLDILAKPVGKTLFFAGEATHREFFSTAHGAYLSGIREAIRICQLF